MNAIERRLFFHVQDERVSTEIGLDTSIERPGVGTDGDREAGMGAEISGKAHRWREPIRSFRCAIQNHLIGLCRLAWL